MANDFDYLFSRTKLAGAAEAVPVVTDTTVVWDLPSSDDLRVSKPVNTLVLVAHGAAFAFELAFWNTGLAVPAWTILCTATARDGVPFYVPFLYDGARVYVRSTAITGADIKVSVWLTISDAPAYNLVPSSYDKVTCTYNADGTIATATYTIGATTVGLVTCTYDASGNLLTATRT